MALESNIVGGVTGLKAEVNAANQLKVVPETDVSTNPGNVGAVKVYGENDEGLLTGTPAFKSPEVDVDYRMRVSQDFIVDEEVFNYTAQNTSKHAYSTSTLANSFTAGQMTTNSGSSVAAGVGSVFSTYAFFPNTGTTTLSADTETAFSAQPTTNVVVEFGLGLPSTALNAVLDGVFFRLSSAGLQGIASFNGTETSTGIFPLSGGTGVWAYTNNKRYQFICYMGGVEAQFWVNNGTGAVLLGAIPLPAAQGRICMAAGVQYFYKHRNIGAASGVLQTFLGAYNVRSGGANYTVSPSTAGNRLYGSYQGLSGETMGSVATLPNSANPVAAAPSNTALTANLPAGFGGQGLVTAAAGAATDGIWGSYQVPVASVNAAGRRRVIRGIRVDLVNTGAAVATTATTIQFALAFGHTSVSLANGEGTAAKAPRRISLGIKTWPVGSAIGSTPSDGSINFDVGDAPIFLNPGEFVQLVGKFLVGTATAAQTIHFTWQPIYGLE